jgi:tRNA A-37 threonylcarbamoyl transferase component Bud32
LTSIRPGTVVDHFSIIEPLGRGGFGEVWKARDLRLNRLVAIKKLPADLVADSSVRERLRREALAASSLNHPNICTIYDFVSIDGEYLLVMEYVDGQTIHDLLRDGPLAAPKAVTIAVQIAQALEEAHQRGILHRDIKSNNVMISASGQVKVLDFGLAKQVDTPDGRTDNATDMRLTREGTAVGTLQYMSPEQLLGRPLDARSDVFSLGVVIYEMLTGRLPFAGSSAAAISDSILHDDPAPALRGSAVPRRLQSIILKALEKDPGRRYASARELVTDLRPASAEQKGTGRRIAYSAVGAILIAAAVAAYFWWRRSAELAWARQTAIPQIESLLQQEKYFEAVRGARKIEPILGDDPVLKTLWSRITTEVSVDSTPAGAEVFITEYGSQEREHLGRTPMRKIRIPRGLYHLWRVEKEGFAPAIRLWPAVGIAGLERDLRVNLPPAGLVPPRTTFVPGREFNLAIPGFEHVAPIKLPDYLIDQDEVTNEEYKRFVDAGGYQKKEYWTEPFVKNGGPVSRADAMAQFVDSTGRPGPAEWELSNYPQGRGSYPVTGISWYEASAYARFAGKRLPTIFHWTGVALTQASVKVAPASNFGSRGPERVGTGRGLTDYGVSDMAGNVKEWCGNSAEGETRYILGGAWNEPTYMFIDQDAQSPWSRAANFGLRCIKSLGPVPPDAERVISIPARDFSKEHPAGGEVFRAYLSAYAYDRTPLNAETVSSDTSHADWIMEKVTMNAAYGSERLIVYIYLPKNARAPFQPALYFPGSGAIHSNDLQPPGLYTDSIPRGGRALVIPIYKGTYERRDRLASSIPAPTISYRDHVVAWGKDLRRTIDYLETRRDIDLQKLSYVGFSWGAAMGPIMAAIEPRIKVCVFLTGGFKFQRAMPEADAIHFAPRVTQPTLMLNARYDQFFPVETSQLPMFRMLATPDSDKRHVVYESGHVIPRTETIKETVAWLNRYLGEPRPAVRR